jgi:N-6 DNA Methylase.
MAVLDLIASQRATRLSSHALIAFVGPGRQEVLELVSQLSLAIGTRQADARTDVLFNQWIRTAGISYGINDPTAPWPQRPARERLLPPTLRAAIGDRTFAETVFVLHSYVAIAAKMVAAEVLAIQKQQPDLRPTQWRFLTDREMAQQLLDLESGVISDQLGAPGLLASDLFDWYAHECAARPGLLASLRHVLAQLGHLAWAQIANAGGMKIDLLRDLYQAVVPRAFRKALGEFFTPRWLAEYVLARALRLYEEAGLPSAGVIPRTLDPACGSGTFLVAAMRTGLQRLDSADLGSDPTALTALTEVVIGIDVNPVSALMSRVNLLLALGDRTHNLPEVRFQVFQADSIVLPRVQVGQLVLGEPGDHFVISTAIRDFRVHASVMRQDRMAALRENLEVALRSRLTEDLYLRALEADLRRLGCADDELAALRPSAEQLYADMATLRDDDKDDVWARVLEQFVSPFLLGQVELVVGNPPWVSWKNLPATWKARSEPIWREWGLWATRRGGRGVPLSDIATLLLARCLSTYAPNGLVALLLPKSVQLADPGGNAFRRSRLRPAPEDQLDRTTTVSLPYRVLAIDDFVAINPFAPDAANQTIALYARAQVQPRFPVPIRIWGRRAGARFRPGFSWLRVEQALQGQDRQVAPVDPNDYETPWGLVPRGRSLPLAAPNRANRYSFGRGYETRGLDGLFEFFALTPARGEPPVFRVRNDPEAGRNTAGETPREGVVESSLFWPLVKGEDVTRWAVAPTERYVLVAYDTSHRPPVPITATRCSTQFPRLFRFLQPWTTRYLERSMYQRELSTNFPWELSGPIEHLATTGALVFIRYLASDGRPAAAVRVPTYDAMLNRESLPYPNNKSNIYYASSEDEAHFLAAFVNSRPAQAALSRFAVSTGVTPGALARLPIPTFESTNGEHARLATLGRRAMSIVASLLLDPMALDSCEAEIDEVVWSLAGEE